MKDFDIIADVSRQDHSPMPLVALIRQQYEAAFANGCGDLDFFVLVREAARIAGLSEERGGPPGFDLERMMRPPDEP
jgi:3-hydroxyisobutyrate dehydrogenase